MENLIITEKIDFYLSGKMSAEEQKAFEEQMNLDAELKREVDLQREVIRAIRKQALRDKVKTFEKKTRFKNLVRIITTALAPIAVAACVAGIVIVPQMQAVASLSEDTQLYSSATIEMIREGVISFFSSGETISFNASSASFTVISLFSRLLSATSLFSAPSSSRILDLI